MGKMLGLNPKMPKLQPVERMPEQDDATVQEARKKRQAEMKARGGRESTIMTDSVGTLGAA